MYGEGQRYSRAQNQHSYNELERFESLRHFALLSFDIQIIQFSAVHVSHLVVFGMYGV
jgi:hypothetical protein